MQGKPGTHTKRLRYRPSRHEYHALDAYYDALNAQATPLTAEPVETEEVYQPTMTIEEWDAAMAADLAAEAAAEEAALVAEEAADDAIFAETVSAYNPIAHDAMTTILAALAAKIAQTPEPDAPAPQGGPDIVTLTLDEKLDLASRAMYQRFKARCQAQTAESHRRHEEYLAWQASQNAVEADPQPDAAQDAPFPMLMNIEVEATIATEQMAAEGFVWNGQTWVRPDDDPDPEPTSPASLPIPTPDDSAEVQNAYFARQYYEQQVISGMVEDDPEDADLQTMQAEAAAYWTWQAQKDAERETFWQVYRAALPDLLNAVDARMDALLDVVYAEQAAGMLATLDAQPSLPESILLAPIAWSSVLDPWTLWLQERRADRDAWERVERERDEAEAGHALPDLGDETDDDEEAAWQAYLEYAGRGDDYRGWHLSEEAAVA